MKEGIELEPPKSVNELRKSSYSVVAGAASAIFAQHAVEVRQASSAHFTRVGMGEMSCSWRGFIEVDLSCSVSSLPLIVVNEQLRRRSASSTVSRR